MPVLNVEENLNYLFTIGNPEDLECFLKNRNLFNDILLFVDFSTKSVHFIRSLVFGGNHKMLKALFSLGQPLDEFYTRKAQISDEILDAESLDHYLDFFEQDEDEDEDEDELDSFELFQNTFDNLPTHKHPNSPFPSHVNPNYVGVNINQLSTDSRPDFLYDAIMVQSLPVIKTIFEAGLVVDGAFCQDIITRARFSQNFQIFNFLFQKIISPPHPLHQQYKSFISDTSFIERSIRTGDVFTLKQLAALVPDFFQVNLTKFHQNFKKSQTNQSNPAKANNLPNNEVVYFMPCMKNAIQSGQLDIFKWFIEAFSYELKPLRLVPEPKPVNKTLNLSERIKAYKNKDKNAKNGDNRNNNNNDNNNNNNNISNPKLPTAFFRTLSAHPHSCAIIYSNLSLSQWLNEQIGDNWLQELDLERATMLWKFCVNSGFLTPDFTFWLQTKYSNIHTAIMNSHLDRDNILKTLIQQNNYNAINALETIWGELDSSNDGPKNNAIETKKLETNFKTAEKYIGLISLSKATQTLSGHPLPLPPKIQFATDFPHGFDINKDFDIDDDNVDWERDDLVVKKKKKKQEKIDEQSNDEKNQQTRVGFFDLNLFGNIDYNDYVVYYSDMRPQTVTDSNPIDDCAILLSQLNLSNDDNSILDKKSQQQSQQQSQHQHQNQHQNLLIRVFRQKFHPKVKAVEWVCNKYLRGEDLYGVFSTDNSNLKPLILHITQNSEEEIMDFFLSKLLSQTLKISQNSQEKNNFSQQFTKQINKITSLIPTSPTSRTLAMIAAYGPGGPLNHCSQARILESLCETMVEMLLILQQFEQGNDRIPQIA